MTPGEFWVIIGTAFVLGMAFTVLILLAIGRNAGELGPPEAAQMYECTACGAGPLVGVDTAREHATAHSAIDNRNWRDVVREVG